MQSSFSYRCERASHDRVTLTLGGTMSKGGLTELKAELDGILAEHPRHLCIIFDLLGVERWNSDARTILLEIQQRIVKDGHRSAYLSNRPRLRGIALWLGHIAEDRNTRPVATMAQAEEWFSSVNGRLEEGIAKIAPAPKKKKKKKGWWSS